MMKKFLLTPVIFMGISFLASAQENAVKSSNEAEIEKTKIEKAEYKKKQEQQKISQRNEIDKKEAQKLKMQTTDEKVKVNKELGVRSDIQEISNPETELSPVSSENISTNMREVTAEKKPATEVIKTRTPAKEKTKSTVKKKTKIKSKQ